MKCPICNEGYLIELVENREIVYKATRNIIRHTFCVCIECEAELTYPAQIDANSKEHREFINNWNADEIQS